MHDPLRKFCSMNTVEINFSGGENVCFCKYWLYPYLGLNGTLIEATVYQYFLCGEDQARGKSERVPVLAATCPSRLNPLNGQVVEEWDESIRLLSYASIDQRELLSFQSDHSKDMGEAAGVRTYGYFRNYLTFEFLYLYPGRERELSSESSRDFPQKHHLKFTNPRTSRLSSSFILAYNRPPCTSPRLLHNLQDLSK